MSSEPAQPEPIRRPLAELTAAEQTALLDASLEAELRELGRAGSPEFREEDGLAWVVGAWPGPVEWGREDVTERLLLGCGGSVLVVPPSGLRLG